MEILRNIKELKNKIGLNKNSIGLVPTMGALHKGHLSLLENARKENEILVASLFVNPKQFGPNEDFEEYPRDFKKDISLFSDSKVDYLFLPDDNEIYPAGFSTYVNNNLEGSNFEGEFRINHFDGVLTVVAKLINIINPKRIYFGEKDAQQLFLVKKMISDLNFNVLLRSVKTVRESNGLACSSRNSYLSSNETNDATNIYKSLCMVSDSWQNGEENFSVLKEKFITNLKHIKNIRIQYVETVDPDTFNSIERGRKAILIIAVLLGNIRLIDNINLD